MRDGAPDEVISGVCTWVARVTSWLDDQLLAAFVPITAGRVTWKADQDIPEKLTITVPRWAAPVPDADVVDWRPSSPTDPLARFGQELDVTIIVGSVVTSQTWETRVGRFLITDWQEDIAGSISVTGEGRLRRVQDAKLTSPMSPRGNLTDEAARLMPPGMGVSFDAALVDRACPTSMSWSDDRLAALQEIAAAWPALLRTDEWGEVAFVAPLPDIPTPIITLQDGIGGTLIGAPRADTRADAFNVVVASAQDDDSIQGIAQLTSGPMAADGPYGPVVKKWSSPLIKSKPTARAAARTMLANSTRPATSVPVSCVPDPRIELDDPIEILRGAKGRMGAIRTTIDTGAGHMVPQPDLWVVDTPAQDIPHAAETTYSNDGTNVTGWTKALVDAAGSGATGATFTVVTSALRLATSGQTVSVNPNPAVSASYVVATEVGRDYTFTGTFLNGFAGLQVRVVWGTQSKTSVLTTDTWSLTFTATSTSTTITLYVEDDPASSTARSTTSVRTDFDTLVVTKEAWTEHISEVGHWQPQPDVWVPDPTIIDQPVWVDGDAASTPGIERVWGWVTGIDLPLTPGDGEMRIDVGVA